MLPETQSPFLNHLRLLWTCPISKSPISDPVITTYGHTYERKALQQWFRNETKDPVTKSQIIYDQPIPNLTLQKIIPLLEKELPKIHHDLTDNQITIRNLNDQVASLKNQLTEEQAKNDALEEQLQNTFQGHKKLKRIHKDIKTNRQNESSRLKQVLAENQQYCRLITELRANEREYQEKLKKKDNDIQKIQQEKYYCEQSAGWKANDFNLMCAWSSAQDNALKKAISFTNDYLEMAFKYNQELMKQHKINTHDFVSRTIDIKGMSLNEYTQTSVIDTYRINMKMHPEQTQLYKEAKNMLQFARIQKVMKNSAQKNLLSWITIDDQIHSHVYSNLSLKAIPFSVPVTDQELMIDWKDVIEIHSDPNTPVEQNQWDQFIQNFQRFPSLISLKIENCNFSRVTAEDLEKLKKMERIVMKKANFKGCQEIVEEFMKKYSWINMTVNYQ